MKADLEAADQPPVIVKRVADQEVTFRQCRLEDGPRVNALYNEVFTDFHRSDAFWKWRSADNPANRGSLGLYAIAETGERIIAQYASSNRVFSVHGQPVLCSYAQDTAVSEEFRKQLIVILKLVEIGHKLGRSIGTLAGFGFPNPTHRMVGAKLMGYKEVAEMAQMFFRLNRYLTVRKILPPLADLLQPLLRAGSAAFYRAKLHRSYAKLAPKCDVAAISKFDDRFDRLWQRKSEKIALIGVRDAEYLNWRYVARPDCEYHRLAAVQRETGEASGYMVLRLKQVNESKVGYIVDFLCDDRESFDALLLQSLIYFTTVHADFCLCLTVPGSPNHGLLREDGFEEKPFTHVIPLVYELITGTDHETFEKPENWYLTYGDTADM